MAVTFRAWTVWLGCVTLGAATLVAVPAAAAAPDTLGVQGTLTSLGGGAVADGTYALTLRLYDGEGPAAKALWEEIQVAVPVKGGVFSTALGVKAGLPLAAFADGSATWFAVAVGGDPELPRVPLRAAAYALQAARAQIAAGLQCSGCVDATLLAKGAVTADKIAPAAVGPAHVNFAWAAADVPGGAATYALGANTAKQADAAKSADYAAFADESAVASSAKALQCTGCLTAAMFKEGVLAKVATSGSYADLGDKPQLVALGSTCGDGQFVRGYGAEGKPVCGTDSGTTYGGKDFAVSNQACAVGSVVTGVDATGKLVCGGTQLMNADKAPVACDPKTYGYMYYNTATSSLAVCTPQGFVSIALVAPLGSQGNPATSCKALLAAQPGTKSGTYWIKPGAKAFEAYCDMTTGGGGWTMCYTTNAEVHIKTELTANAVYGKSGYRADCNDLGFTELLYVNHDSGQSAWFSRDGGAPVKLSATSYNTPGSDLGLWSAAGGVASAAYKYQLNVCDTAWMWTGLMMTGYTSSCFKKCNDWCGDTQSPYFRVDGDDKSDFNGVSFNENGHQNVSTKVMSVGVR